MAQLPAEETLQVCAEADRGHSGSAFCCGALSRNKRCGCRVAMVRVRIGSFLTGETAQIIPRLLLINCQTSEEPLSICQSQKQRCPTHTTEGFWMLRPNLTSERFTAGSSYELRGEPDQQRFNRSF